MEYMRLHDKEHEEETYPLMSGYNDSTNYFINSYKISNHIAMVPSIMDIFYHKLYYSSSLNLWCSISI